jgi:hypothetical protein
MTRRIPAEGAGPAFLADRQAHPWMQRPRRVRRPDRGQARILLGLGLTLGLPFALAALGLAAPVGLWLKYDYLTAPLLILGGFLAIARLGQPAAGRLVLAGMLAVTSLVLFGMWAGGVSDGQVIAGLLPYSDGNGYYADALRILHGERLSAFSSRRPLFAAWLAVLLGLTLGNLPATLAILSLLTTAAICLAAREAERCHGAPAAALLLACLFLFSRRYTGTMLTEHHGLLFGCLAFVLLWRGSRLGRPLLVVAGTFLLSLGLLARAGAFLVLPLIAVWAAREFRGERRLALGVLAACSAAVLGALGLNGLLLVRLGVPEAAFGNFAWTLYGLVFGGDWTLALAHHPELASLPPVQQTQAVYALAADRIRQEPTALVSGCLRAWSAFFLSRTGSVFSLVQHFSPEGEVFRASLESQGRTALAQVMSVLIGLNVLARRAWLVGLNLLAVAGLVRLWRSRRSPCQQLICALWLGMLASVPFAPPWDADYMRAYAATAPFIVALPLLGIARPVPSDPARPPGERRDRLAGSAGLVALCAVLLGLQAAGPFAVRGLAAPAPGGAGATGTSTCEAGREAVHVRLLPAAAVYLTDAEHPGRAPGGRRLALRDFRARFYDRGGDPQVTHWTLPPVSAGDALALAFETARGTTLVTQFTGQDAPRQATDAVLCGQRVRRLGIAWFLVDPPARR